MTSETTCFRTVESGYDQLEAASPQLRDVETTMNLGDDKPKQLKVLLLSTSLLVDRVFRYSGLIDRLSKFGNIEIWNSSFDEDAPLETPGGGEAQITPFPEVRAFREFRHNFPRRLNEFVWDYRHRPVSRMSIMRHRRDRDSHLAVRALRLPARLLAAMRAERLSERWLEKWLLAYQRSPEATRKLKDDRPDAIVLTGPFQFEQPAIHSAAKALGIPVIAYIPSWDNISTKNRMVFNYDGYIVWNDDVKKQLHEFYPTTVDVPIYVVGAPQFDAFSQERFYQTREDFFLEHGFDPDKPLILYAIGSPNFLKEHHGALHLARQIAEGALGDVQMLVRPHPIHDNAEMKEMFESFEPRTKIQTSPHAGRSVSKRAQDEKAMVEWINTFRHTDVVVNLSSTVSIDAALFDKPVVNLDFDPQPGHEDQELIKEINHKWTHFKPVAESGGVWLVNDLDEMADAVRTYLKQPELHRQERKQMVEFVCKYVDGDCGTRMADAILDFVGKQKGYAALQSS